MRFRNHSASFQDDETTVPQETPWSIWISLAINRGWLGFSERRKWRFIAGKTKMQMVDLCHCHVCLPQGTGKADITSAAESLKSRITALGTVMWPWGPRPENVTFFFDVHRFTVTGWHGLWKPDEFWWNYHGEDSSITIKIKAGSNWWST